MCDYCANPHRNEEHDCARCGARFCLDDGSLRVNETGESDWICISCQEELAAPPEMYLCRYCGQHHPISTKEWLCPLAPKGV
jgi:hypothetical protein